MDGVPLMHAAGGAGALEMIAAGLVGGGLVLLFTLALFGLPERKRKDTKRVDSEGDPTKQ
jgi:hypothetical protein